jgi:fatty acid desaturase
MTQTTNTLRLEAESGRRNTPDFCWPTIALAAGLFAVAGTATWAALAGHIPYLAAAAVNTAFIYFLYTVVHEAAHANISSRRKRLAWVDLVVGTIACIPLWLFFHQHKRQHMVHHTRTNFDDDPDIYARGGFWGWLFWRLPKALIAYFNPFQLYRECLLFGVPKTEIRITMATFALQAAVVIALIAAGYGLEVLVLWFIPWWIGQTVMLTLFTWTPHHDHTETGRYRNTRVSLFPGADLLLLGQNLHLIHHMMPGIPFYRYRKTFDEIRPLLEQNGVRIEGLWPRPTEGGMRDAGDARAV